MKLIFLFLLFISCSAFSVEIIQKKNIGFHFSVDSSRGPSYSVSIIENHLLVVNSFGGDSIPISWCSERVNSNLLNDIYLKLKNLGVYDWKRFYHKSYVRDGSKFKLSLNYNDMKLHIFGDNDFPENYDQLIKYIQHIVKESTCEHHLITSP